MAEAYVTTWAELTEAWSRPETTDIYLMNDIDLNDEFPEGITSGMSSGSYTKTLYGNGHSIKNIRCTNNNINIFAGRGEYLESSIHDTKFLNAFIAGYSSNFARYVHFYDSSLVIELDKGSNSIGPSIISGTGNFVRCGVSVNGYNSASIAVGSGSTATQKFTDCNVKINGSFAYCIFNLQNSYLAGSFESSDTYAVSFNNSATSVINASIKTSKAITAASTSSTVINTDLLEASIAETLPTTLIPCTTEELKSAQALKDKKFPIGVD